MDVVECERVKKAVVVENAKEKKNTVAWSIFFIQRTYDRRLLDCASERRLHGIMIVPMSLTHVSNDATSLLTHTIHLFLAQHPPL